ncbi:hypothetical protein [Fluviicola sp.]|jgi:hypothetical protein|uniref:hypothetical protein n=1 Tax=Fluviicola sp. TaxID=1917219 RepID=UPI0028242CEB|nr:hypothetical protein [Fluviicola sp.]MDR0802594.1 hypothetical protein [Fluviicola sp.]
MSEFHFESIREGFPEQLTQKKALWIWNADKIPPHIGISLGKEYFSLTYRKSEYLQVVSMVKRAKRSKIPLVLVEFSAELTSGELTRVFSKYERAIDGITCLHPIREVLRLDAHANQLADLLTLLKSNDRINRVHGLNLPEVYTGIPDYSVKDILNWIYFLNNNI